METEKGKIESLQALRAIAFIGIFLSHANAPYSWPALGVSVFYVLSGFLMNYNHMLDELDYSYRGRIKFSTQRIKKLYPLHIVTMICAIVLDLAIRIHAGLTIRSIIILSGEVVLNILLMQTWFPYSSVNVSLNGVAWYLSVTMFLYFMFPRIQRFIRCKKQKTLWLICAIILLSEWIICIPLIRLLGNDNPIYIWFMYCFPVFRLGDFFIGCALGKFYDSSVLSKKNILQSSVIEVIVLAFTILVFEWIKVDQNNVFLLSLHNWTTIYIPLATIWIFLFAEKSGIITKALSNKLLINIGNISPYTFLIHYVVTRYINSILNYFDIVLPTLPLITVILLELIITVILTLAYKKIEVKLLAIFNTIGSRLCNTIHRLALLNNHIKH